MYNKATPGKRLLAALIDFIIYYVIQYVASLIYYAAAGITRYSYNEIFNIIQENPDSYMDIIGDNVTGSNLFTTLLTLVIFFAYFVVIPYFWKHQTIGRLATKTKIVFGNEKPSFGGFALRELVGTYLISMVLLVCCCIPGIINLVFLFGKDNEVIADKIAGTTFVDSTMIEIPDDEQEGETFKFD